MNLIFIIVLLCLFILFVSCESLFLKYFAGRKSKKNNKNKYKNYRGKIMNANFSPLLIGSFPHKDIDYIANLVLDNLKDYPSIIKVLLPDQGK